MLVLLALLTACGGGDGAPTAPAGQTPPAAVVTTIAVSPSAATLTAIDDTRQLTASARDQSGATMSGVSFTWSSSDEEVATVDEDGLVTARGHGTATITAAVSDVDGTAAVNVEQTSEAVAVEPAEATFSAPGEQVQFHGVAEDANGHPVAAERFAWSSGDADVVTVDADGLATAHLPGDATITAAVGEVEGEAAVTVEEGDAPLVLSVSPDPMVEGEPATLTGINFGATPGANEVRVDGVEAQITSASAEELHIVVPTFDCRPARTGEVTVTVGAVDSSPRSAGIRSEEDALQLSAGELLLLEDPDDFCLRFDEQPSGESYLVGVQSTSDAVASLTPVTVTAETAAGESGGALLSLASRPPASGAGRLVPTLSERWRAHRAAEARLRSWERGALLAGGAAAAGALPGSGPRLSRTLHVAAAVPEVDDVVAVRVPDLSSGNLCSTFNEVAAVVRAVGTRGIWLEDPDNPADGFTSSDFQDLSDRFDAAIHVTNVEYLGTPTDVDENERVVVVVSKEVNGTSNALGFVFGGDFFPRSSCASSDEGEIFYGRAPDPTGEFASVYPTAAAQLDYPWVIAHELAHVIQMGRRIDAAAPLMDGWMMEAQATLLEEVVGHEVTGRSPGQDYGYSVAFNDPATDEIAWYRNAFIDLAFYYGFQTQTTRVAGAPQECGWLVGDPSPCVGRALWYGVGWSLLRWLSDQFGPGHAGGEAGLHRKLVDSGLTGFGNLSAVADGASKERMLAWWAATLYTDGRLSGGEPRLGTSSWNLLDVFANLVATARLTPLEFAFADFQATGSVRAGSSGYLRIGGSGRPETALRVRDAADQPLGASMQVWVVRLE